MRKNPRPGCVSFFSSAAAKEGYEQIAGIFQETSDNEREHAKLFFKLLPGGMAEITASYPSGIIGTVAGNLLAGQLKVKNWNGTLTGFRRCGPAGRFGERSKRSGISRPLKPVMNVGTGTAFKYPE